MSNEAENAPQESQTIASECQPSQAETTPENKTYLTIHSDYSTRESSSSHTAGDFSEGESGRGVGLGHSWLEVQEVNAAGEVVKNETFGTWNFPPQNYDAERSSQEGSGMYVNAELERPSDVSRTTELDPAQAQELRSAVEDYRNRGDEGWSYREPCSHFASEVWERSTGEYLRDGWISTPRGLGSSIQEANGGEAHGYKEAESTPEHETIQNRCSTEKATESDSESERETSACKLF